MAKLEQSEHGFAIILSGTDHLARVHITGNYPQYKYFRKLEDLSSKFPNEYKLIHEDKDQDGRINHRTYTVPIRLACGLRAPSTRTLTEEQHQALVERGRKLAETSPLKKKHTKGIKNK